MDYIIVLSLGILILLVAYLLVSSSKSADKVGILQENDKLKAEIIFCREQLAVNTALLERQQKEMDAERDILIRNLETSRAERISLQLEFERTKAGFNALQQRLNEQREETILLHQRLNKDFELLANRILEEKSNKFNESNKHSLDILLSPLKENIKAFEEKVDKVYRTEATERNILQGEIRKLMELNQQLSNEANNLTRALKADNKKQGNWGEIVLDRILEASGLLLNESYSKQVSYSGEEGERFQPDVVINLPDNKHLIIDAKVSLIAYNNLMNAETEEDRSLFLKQHIVSLKNHIKGLSAKNYADLYHIESPDFVLLFIPIESSFSIAVQHDIELFEFAWNRKVVMVSPSTLLATLKTIASVWKHERQTKNAIEIATKAGQMYDKFASFVGDLTKLGDQLDRSKNVYNDAFNKLSGGNGNLISRAEKLKQMGAKASKSFNIRIEDEELLNGQPISE